MSMRSASCGSWPSPITAEVVASGQVSISEACFDAGELLWMESRPAEGGRSVVMAVGRDGAIRELLPAGWNVRTRVHEYGGGAWARRDGTLYFCEFRSQRMFRMDPGGDPVPITPEGPGGEAPRYADADVSPDGKWIVSVRERHFAGGSVENDIVAFPADGSEPPRSLVSGHDFFSCPRIAPDGRRLLWTSWDHPRMPWEGTDLWMAELGPACHCGTPVHLAGGIRESVFQPSWRSSAEICFISDRTGFGNLYAWADGDSSGVRPLLPMAAEFAVPQWVFGLSRYAFIADDGIVVVFTSAGRDHLGVLDAGGVLQMPDVGYTSIVAVASDQEQRVAVVGGSPSRAMELASGPATGELAVVRSSQSARCDTDYISRPQHIEFPTSSDRVAYAFFYPPQHPECVPGEGERPPLVVTSHGGPTGAASSTLNPAIQFWTTRGFAVVDVNYRGSTGYGRVYTESLKGAWGIADVEDCVAAARWLVSAGGVDPRRMVIRGKSASGLTTLSALVFHDDFCAGASYYGVADPESLARDTHKFESHYLESLIGPYPERRDLYRSRSPLVHAERLRTPVIFFQGTDDVVVPPSQAEALIRILDARGLPYAYMRLEGESHGFRRSESVRCALEAELGFYSRILGFDPADELEPVDIRNL